MTNKRLVKTIGMAAMSNAAFVTAGGIGVDDADGDDDTSSVRTIFHPVGDYISKGGIEELTKRISELENSDQQNKERILALEKTSLEKEGEIQQLQKELKKYIESNKQLVRELEKIKKENRDMKFFFRQMSKIADREPGLSKYKKEFEEFAYDENLKKQLSQSGTEKKNWWKVLALGLAVGVIGVAIGGGVPMLIAGPAVITGEVATCAAIGGGVGAAIGGVDTPDAPKYNHSTFHGCKNNIRAWVIREHDPMAYSS
ncbi:uncharacterized protein LOC144425221 [Styela clava]